MALKTLIITCDNCYASDEEYDTVNEAVEVGGWWIVTGPERHIGGDGERAYCCKDCLDSDIL